MRQSIPVPKHIAIALWRLATGSYYNTFGHIFGISEGSVGTVCEEVAGLIIENLMPRFIEFPVGPKLDKVVSHYSKCPLKRGHTLQISLGKTRNTATCMHGLMTSHAAAKDHMTP